MNTAESRLSTQTVSSSKTHNHEAEIRMKASHSTFLSWRLFKKSICNHTPTYNRIFLDVNISKWTSQGPEIQPSHASPSTSTLPPLPLSTPHLVFAKKINFSVTRGKYFPQTEGGSVSLHTHRQTPAVWMMLSQVKGPHAYSAEEIFVSARNHANSY